MIPPVPPGQAWCSGHKTFHLVKAFAASRSRVRKRETQRYCKAWMRRYTKAWRKAVKERRRA